MYNREKLFLLKDIPKGIIDLLEESNAVIAGGAITSVFSRNRISDYDIFFRSSEDRKKITNKLISRDYEVVFETPVALTFRIHGLLFQVIFKVTGEPEQIINGFDFTVCAGAYDFKSDKFILHDDFLRDLAQRKLYYIGSAYPIASMVRVRKFLNKGFDIPGTEIIKLSLDIHNLKIETMQDLKDQLYGIDAVILSEFLEKIEGNSQFDYDIFMEMLNGYLEEIA